MGLSQLFVHLHFQRLGAACQSQRRGGHWLKGWVIQTVLLPSQWINSMFSADAVKWINLRLLLCTLLSKYPSEIFAELVI